jgi:hypothetical protein
MDYRELKKMKTLLGGRQESIQELSLYYNACSGYRKIQMDSLVEWTEKKQEGEGPLEMF